MGSRARKTVGMGAVRKSSRQHSDPEINRIIDDVYKELNKLSISVNLKASANTSSHSEGSSGDIRLFKGAGQDGSVGYFIQGKFGDGWGTARLSLEHKNPEVSELGGGNTTVGGGVPFSVMSNDVLYELLASNGDVGWLPGQLAPGYLDGQPLYHHWKTAEVGSEHYNDIHFPLSTADVDSITTTIEASSESTTGNSDISARQDHQHDMNVADGDLETVQVYMPGDSGYSDNTTNPSGTSASFARADHSHTIDTTLSYQYFSAGATDEHLFTIDISGDKVIIGKDDWADTPVGLEVYASTIDLTGESTLTGDLDMTGDLSVDGAVEITGNLNVGWAETVTGDSELEGNVTLGVDTVASQTVQAWSTLTIGSPDYNDALVVHGNITIKESSGSLMVRADNNSLLFAVSAGSGNVETIGTLTAGGHTDLDSTVTIDGLTTINDDLTTTGNIGIGIAAHGVRTLDVAGQIGLDSNIHFDVAGDHYFKHEGGTASTDKFTFRFSDDEDVLTIVGDGNVGIGRTDPTEKLEVYGGHIKIQNSGDANLYINAHQEDAAATIYFEEEDSVKAKIQHVATNDSLLFTDGSNTDVMTIKGGKVGINRAAPGKALDVEGDIRVAGTNSLFLNHVNDNIYIKSSALDISILNSPTFSLNAITQANIDTPDFNIDSADIDVTSTNIQITGGVTSNFSVVSYTNASLSSETQSLTSSTSTTLTTPLFDIDATTMTADGTTATLTYPNINITSTLIEITAAELGLSGSIDIEGNIDMAANQMITWVDTDTYISGRDNMLKLSQDVLMTLESPEITIDADTELQVDTQLFDINAVSLALDGVTVVLSGETAEYTHTVSTEIKSPDIHIDASGTDEVLDIDADLMRIDGTTGFISYTAQLSLGSTTEIEMNTALLDVNADSINLTGTTCEIANDDETSIISDNAIHLITAGGSIYTTTALFDVDATTLTMDGTTGTITYTDKLTLDSTTETEMNTALLDINATVLTMNGTTGTVTYTDKLQLDSTTETEMNSALLDFNTTDLQMSGTTGNINMTELLELFSVSRIDIVTALLDMNVTTIDIDGGTYTSTQVTSHITTAPTTQIIADTILDFDVDGELDIDANNINMDGDTMLRAQYPVIRFFGDTSVLIDTPLLTANADIISATGNQVNVTYTGKIDLVSDTEIELTAPLLDVNATTLESYGTTATIGYDETNLEATTMDIDAITLTIDGTLATITYPTIDIIASTEIDINSPLVELSGVLDIEDDIRMHEGKKLHWHDLTDTSGDGVFIQGDAYGIGRMHGDYLWAMTSGTTGNDGTVGLLAPNIKLGYEGTVDDNATDDSTKCNIGMYGERGGGEDQGAGSFEWSGADGNFKFQNSILMAPGVPFRLGNPLMQIVNNSAGQMSIQNNDPSGEIQIDTVVLDLNVEQQIAVNQSITFESGGDGIDWFNDDGPPEVYIHSGEHAHPFGHSFNTPIEIGWNHWNRYQTEDFKSLQYKLWMKTSTDGHVYTAGQKDYKQNYSLITNNHSITMGNWDNDGDGFEN